MKTARASLESIRQHVSRHAEMTSRSVGRLIGTRARVRKLLVIEFTRIGVGSIACTTRSVVRSARPSPRALPRVSVERSSTASRVTTGRGKSGIVSTRWRPMTFGSIPVPLKFLPNSPTISTSIWSNGRRAISTRDSSSSFGSTSRISSGSTPTTRAVCSRAFSRIASPSTTRV